MHRNRKRISISAKKLAYMLMVLFAVPGLAKAQTGREALEEPRIERVLGGLRPPIAIKGQPPVRWKLAERMADSHVPGLSIAVIDDGKIAWARGFGVREAGTNEPVTTSTLFEAQSISKAVAATATLVLVNSGRLSLDESPNTYLKSWKLPYNEFQAHEKVTLRRILSHSSGLSVGGFAGYRTGDALPTLLQILNGEKPANNPPIRVDFTPGSMSRYSGGGAEVMQQLLMDVTGQPFPELMKRLVLGPAGMTLSTYEQPLPEARWSNAASGHDGARAVIKGKWPNSSGDGGWRPVDDADGSCKVGAGNHQGLEGERKQTLLEGYCDRDAYRSKGALRPWRGACGDRSEPRIFTWRIELRLPCISRDVPGSREGRGDHGQRRSSRFCNRKSDYYHCK